MPELKEVQEMKLEGSKFVIAVGEGETSGLLLCRDLGLEVRDAILARLSELVSDTVLNIDFGSVKYMDGGCANLVVVGVLRGIESGKYPQALIVLSNVKEQPRGNIQFILEATGKSVLVLEEKGWAILGNRTGSWKLYRRLKRYLTYEE